LLVVVVGSTVRIQGLGNCGGDAISSFLLKRKRLIYYALIGKAKLVSLAAPRARSGDGVKSMTL